MCQPDRELLRLERCSVAANALIREWCAHARKDAKQTGVEDVVQTLDVGYEAVTSVVWDLSTEQGAISLRGSGSSLKQL